MKHRRKKKQTTAKVRRLTLALWSRAVRARAGGKCEVCGCVDGSPNAKGNPRRLNAHHIEDRANQALRFDIQNGVALCPTCHKFGRDSAHKSPMWFMLWLSGHARDRYEDVFARRNLPPPDRARIEVLRDELTKYLGEA